MIEKLENTYLAILRFVVIAVAGILLVAAVILGLNSLKAIQFKPEIKKTLKVSEQELIKGIAEKPTKPQSKHPDDAADVNKTDLNIAFYERASNAIVNFVAKYSGGAEIVAKEQVVAIIQERAESLNDPILVTAFAKGFAESMVV
ncbi:MAG TPA: hypothetical protein PKW07_00745 [Syntrophorhabdaceae bacterium]|nr:hypothetical protein [Syntrophorhabdaceae bacterium]